MKEIKEIISTAAGRGGNTVAVAAAHDEDVLLSAANAKKNGISSSILVGNAPAITEILARLGENPGNYEIIHAENDSEAAVTAVGLVRNGRASLLMKGLMGTSDLLRAVVDKENGLRSGGLLSHVMICEIPGYHKLLTVTDGGMNTYPDLEKKAWILENAAGALAGLGYGSIAAACVCGAEAVDPKIQATLDADALSKMTERWSKYNMDVFGPVGLDLAISAEACRHKKYAHPCGGDADILLVPAYETGNIAVKTLTYFAGAKTAGLVLGAKAPIVLVSRSDTAETKLASIAFGCVARG